MVGTWGFPNTHLYLVPNLRMRGAVNLLSTYASKVYTATNFLLPFTLKLLKKFINGNVAFRLFRPKLETGQIQGVPLLCSSCGQKWKFSYVLGFISYQILSSSIVLEISKQLLIQLNIASWVSNLLHIFRPLKLIEKFLETPHRTCFLWLKFKQHYLAARADMLKNIPFRREDRHGKS
jgi:hypothetical protein